MKLDRMISIIMILLERRKIRVAELARICEVTTRTIQRDLEAINMAGIPVLSFSGPGGGVGIMDSYKLEKRLFSTSDVTTLLMGLGSIRSSLTGDEVAATLAKIQGMIPEEHRSAIELKAGQIAIDTTSWMGGYDCGEAMTFLQTALDERRLLSFAYNDRNLNKTSRTVEPYRLVLKSMNWYFEGYCLERRDFRIFRLSRMSDITLLDERYVPRDFKPQAAIRPSFHDRHEAVKCVLRIREGAIEPLVDLFGPVCIERESDTTWIARVEVFEHESGFRFLLGLGLDCECLTPENMRNGLKEYTKQVLGLYSE